MPNCPATDTCGDDVVAGTNATLETNLGLPACFGLPPGGAPVLAGVTYTGGECGGRSRRQQRADRHLWRREPLRGPARPPDDRRSRGVASTSERRRSRGGHRSTVVPVQVVRYTIATDPNDPTAPNDPNFRHLWRSTTGARSAADAWAEDDESPPGPTWQLVARGINDLQVTYVDGDGLRDEPQVFAAATDWDFIVRQVNVTLSSRVGQAMIAGFTGTDMTDPAQIRLGQLVSQIAPRAGLIALQNAPDDEDKWK